MVQATASVEEFLRFKVDEVSHGLTIMNSYKNAWESPGFTAPVPCPTRRMPHILN